MMNPRIGEAYVPRNGEEGAPLLANNRRRLSTRRRATMVMLVLMSLLLFLAGATAYDLQERVNDFPHCTAATTDVCIIRDAGDECKDSLRKVTKAVDISCLIPGINLLTCPPALVAYNIVEYDRKVIDVTLRSNGADENVMCSEFMQDHIQYHDSIMRALVGIMAAGAASMVYVLVALARVCMRQCRCCE